MPPKSSDTLSAHYETLVSQKRLKPDDAQRAIVKALEKLSATLGKPLKSLFRKQTQGIYIWGSVGRGKSMLMDLFFENAPVKKKRRVHFHAFMQEVHSRLHLLRQKEISDPVALLSKQLAEEVTLLCFDELQMTDVADATLIYRLFSGLFEEGTTLVSTSNHPPASLYTGGVQRERFDKFIGLIEQKMQILTLTSPTDYRRTKMRSLSQRYVWPLDENAKRFIVETIETLCSNPEPQKETLTIKGHKLTFDLYAPAVGRFTFDALCGKALGAADYLALVEYCDTIIMTDIPKLSAQQRNEAKRFATLIDVLYEHRIALLCTAAVPPEQIYREGDVAFEFKRTVSRLNEMQSAQWGETL